MAVTKLTVAVFLLLISTQPGQQQQCSVDNLPEFGTTLERNTPDRDRFQAIVPAYTFQCTGRVTEWRACVAPGGMSSEQYYIQFQVWRPTFNGFEGCYELVDYNIPLDDAGQEEMNVSNSTSIIEAEGSLSPPGDSSDPLYRCVVLPVRESQQIEFQPGDVVGYYVDHFNDGVDRTDGGIQWIGSTETVAVYYTVDIPRDDIKTQYALDFNPSSCGFQLSSTGSSHILISTTASAPIISLTFTTMMLASTVAPMLTSTSPPPGPVVASTSTSLPPGPVVASTPTSPPPQPVTSSTITTTSVTTQPEMSPSVPPPATTPPATTPRVSNDNITILGSVLAIIIVAIAVFTVATVVISVLVWLKKRKMEPELVDNVAYHSHNMELITSPNSAYNTVSTAIPTTTNEAYVATRIPTSPNTAYEVVQATPEERDIDTKTNEAYVSIGIATSINEAYQPVQSASDNTQASHAVSTAIPTTTNEAYVATRIPTSPNTAYEVVQETPEERDIDTKANEAYVATDIAASVNEAYQPVQSTSDNTQASHAVSTAIPITTNEAYVATRIPTSPNTAYEVVQATAEERDIDTKANEAYVATGIATSVNEAYQPVQSASDNTPVYDYARPQ